MSWSCLVNEGWPHAVNGLEHPGAERIYEILPIAKEMSLLFPLTPSVYNTDAMLSHPFAKEAIRTQQ